MPEITQTDAVINNKEKSDEDTIVLNHSRTEELNMISIEQLAEDSTKISIDNGRWVVDSSKKYAICLSEEFEQAVIACTNLNPTEWGGFIVGHDLQWINPETKKIVRILIAERVVILGQTRSGASMEITEEAVDAWMDSKSNDDMSMYQVFLVKRWKKIGWVHSHADLGCFWSSTDTDTMKQMRDVPLLLSIVYSRKGDGTLDKRIRVDQNDLFFGSRYNMIKDDISEQFVYSEKNIEKLSDVSEEIQEKFKKILADTQIIIGTTLHTDPSKKVVSYSGGCAGQYPVRHYYNSFDEDYWESKGWTGAKKSEATLKTLEILGDYSEDIKETIQSLGMEYFQKPKEERSNLTILDFFLKIDDTIQEAIKDDVLDRKWKMKELFSFLKEEHILNIFEYFLKKDVLVQLCLKMYHNFKDFAKNLFKLVVSYVKKHKELKKQITEMYGKDWKKQLEKSLNEVEDIKIREVEIRAPEVEEEKPPEPYMVENFTDWREWYLYLPKKYQNAFMDVVFRSAEDDATTNKVLKKIADGLSYIVKSEEEEFANYTALIYENFVNIYDKTPEKYRESYRTFYTSFFRETFSTYFSSYNNSKKLQALIDALGEDYVKQFINDFIVAYETEEELKEIVDKFSDKFPVYRQTFRCPICGLIWVKREDANKCEEACTKLGRTKDTKVTEIVLTETTKKSFTPARPQVSTPTISTMTTPIGGQYIGRKEPRNIYKTEYLYGIPITYFDNAFVCNYCGSLFETQEAAEACEISCADYLEAAKKEAIERYGDYKCDYCGAIFNDAVSAVDHVDDCKSYGAVLSFLFELMNSGMKIGSSIKEIIEIFKRGYGRTYGTPSPIIEWLFERSDGDDGILTCSFCGAKVLYNIDIENSLKFAIMDMYTHERFCKIANKSSIVSWRGGVYKCGLCLSPYEYSSPFSRTIADHMQDSHGIYPTQVQISNLAGVGKKQETSSEKSIAVESTDNANMLNGAIFCKHCLKKFYKAVDFLRHLGTDHQINITPLEYEEYLNYEERTMPSLESLLREADKVAIGSLDVSREELETENVWCRDGLLVCKSCGFKTREPEIMLAHVLEEDSNGVGMDEVDIWAAYVEKTARYSRPLEDNYDLCDILSEEDYIGFEDSLDDVYEEWVRFKVDERERANICGGCGKAFVEKETLSDNSWECFLHECVCVGMFPIDLADFMCAECGTLHMTILEKELCEEKHHYGV